MADGDSGSKTARYGSSIAPPFREPGTADSAPPVGSLPPRARTEVTTRLSEELARFGAVGQVHIDGGEVVLRHPTGPRRAPIDEWLDHWELLDEPTRRLRVSQLARTLARPTSLPVSRPPSALRMHLGSWIGLCALVSSIALGVMWTVGDLGRASAGPPRAASAPDGATRTDKAAAASTADKGRPSLVCAATRARVVRGATVTVADAEGWVVEYLAFRPLAQGAPASEAVLPMRELTQFFEAPTAAEGSRYIWPEEPTLSTTPTSEDRVFVRSEPVTGAIGTTHSGVRITFAGALVDAYFRPATRGAYFHLASALTDRLGAAHAALYARCAYGDTHHLGSWFRGRDHQEAVAALVYSLGTFAEPPHLADPFLRPLGGREIDRALAFGAITRVSTALDRPLVASLIGREGGMVMGRPGEAVTLTFPFEDGNRASRLSREIARLTEIGGQ